MAYVLLQVRTVYNPQCIVILFLGVGLWAAFFCNKNEKNCIFKKVKRVTTVFVVCAV